MRRSEYRIRDLTGEYIILDAWDADAFASEMKLSPVEYSEARSKVVWWARVPRIARDLRERVLGASARTEFYPGAAERALEDAFRLRWKLFKLPRAEPQAVKIADGAVGASPAYVPPPPAPPADEEDKPKTWFEVKVVDVYGDPVSDAEVVFSQAGKQLKAKTNSGGVASWEDVEGPSFATVKLSQLKELRESLKDRWGKKIGKEGLEGDKYSIYDEELTSSLVSETPKTVILYQPVPRIRLVGMHFDTNKCFLLPEAMPGVRKVVVMYKQLSEPKLLVVGHADRAGTDDYNDALALERADAISAYLRDEVDAWLDWFGESKPAEKRWGMREIQLMLSALPVGGPTFWDGPPTGAKDPKTKQAVKDFQAWRNETAGAGLAVDGNPGSQTRRELVAAYMEIDGTTLPDGAETVSHGCGEHFPAHPTPDGVADERNRRVEVFGFSGQIQPPPPGKQSKAGSPQYPQWDKQVTDNVDFGVDGLTCLVVDDVGTVISQARVTLSGPQGAQTQLTGSDGLARFLNVTKGDYVVRAERGRYAPSERAVVVPLATSVGDAPAGGGAALGFDGPPKAATAPAKAEPIVTLTLTRIVDLVVYVRDQVGAPLQSVRVERPGALSKAVPDSDQSGRAVLRIEKGEKLAPKVELKVSPPHPAFDTVTVTVPAAELTSASTTARGYFVVTATLRAKHKPKRRYYWQNAKLRDVIYPTRRIALRRFLGLYAQWDTEASPLPTPDPTDADLDYVLEKAAEISALKLVAEKDRTIADWDAAERRTFFPGLPEQYLLLKPSAKKPKGETEPEHRERTKKLLQSNKSKLKSFRFYEDTLRKSDHNDLILKITERFAAHPEQHRAWVRYMVVHYSGMRYQNAHENSASFGRPSRLAHLLRREEIPVELDEAKSDDEQLVEYVLEALWTLTNDDGERKTPEETTKAKKLIADLKGRIEKAVPKTTRDAPHPVLTTGERAKAVDALLYSYYKYFAEERSLSLSPAEAIGALQTRIDNDDNRKLRASRYVFAPLAERDVIMNTQLLADADFVPQWGTKEKPGADVLAFEALGDTPHRRALRRWKYGRPFDPVTKKYTDAQPAPDINENSTSWRQYHFETLEPVVSRAVCDQISDISMHVRGASQPGMIGGGGIAPKANAKPLTKMLADVPVPPPSPATTLFFLNWGVHPAENVPEKVVSTKLPKALLVEPGSGGGPLHATAAKPIPASPGALEAWCSDSPITKEEPVVVDKKPVFVDGKPVTTPVLHDRILLWGHEATVVEVRGARVVTFETATPTAINVRSNDDSNAYFVTWSPDEVKLPDGDPRIASFLTELLDASDPDPATAPDVVAQVDDGSGSSTSPATGVG